MLKKEHATPSHIKRGSPDVMSPNVESLTHMSVAHCYVRGSRCSRIGLMVVRFGFDDQQRWRRRRSVSVAELLDAPVASHRRW
jgi:hypothetical protein